MASRVRRVPLSETQSATGPRTTRLKIADARTGAQREAFQREAPFWAEWTPAGDEIAWVNASGVAVGLRLVRPDGSGERAIYGTGGIPEAQVITVDFGTLVDGHVTSVLVTTSSGGGFLTTHLGFTSLSAAPSFARSRSISPLLASPRAQPGVRCRTDEAGDGGGIASRASSTTL